MNELVSMPALARLVKVYNDSSNVISFIKELIYNYEPKINLLIDKKIEAIALETFEDCENPNRPLFSPKTAQKVLKHISGEIVEAKE